MTDLQFDAVTPKAFVPVWVCRHCKAEKRIKPDEPKPTRCWNRHCRRMDWDREKILPGRPSKKTGRPKGSKTSSKHRSKRR